MSMVKFLPSVSRYSANMSGVLNVYVMVKVKEHIRQQPAAQRVGTVVLSKR
jgi:hypothetical protein